jgi:hypothetical protein
MFHSSFVYTGVIHQARAVPKTYLYPTQERRPHTSAMQPKAPDQTKQATLPRNETKTNNAVQMHIFPNSKSHP